MGVLNDSPVFPILLARDLDAAKAFYLEMLGLELIREDHGDRIVVRTGSTRRAQSGPFVGLTTSL